MNVYKNVTVYLYTIVCVFPQSSSVSSQNFFYDERAIASKRKHQNQRGTICIIIIVHAYVAVSLTMWVGSECLGLVTQQKISCPQELIIYEWSIHIMGLDFKLLCFSGLPIFFHNYSTLSECCLRQQLLRHGTNTFCGGYNKVLSIVEMFQQHNFSAFTKFLILLHTLPTYIWDLHVHCKF